MTTLQDLAGWGGAGGRQRHDRPRLGRFTGGLLAALVGMLLLGGCSDEGDATASGTVDETITSTASTPAEQTTAPTPSRYGGPIPRAAAVSAASSRRG